MYSDGVTMSARGSKQNRELGYLEIRAHPFPYTHTAFRIHAHLRKNHVEQIFRGYGCGHTLFDARALLFG